MALESVAGSAQVPATINTSVAQPVVSPAERSGGVATIQNDPDSVIVSLSESLRVNGELEDGESGVNRHAEETAERTRRSILATLSRDYAVRLGYDADRARSYVEIYNANTNYVLTRIPSEALRNLLLESSNI